MADETVSLGLLMEIKAQGAEILASIMESLTGLKESFATTSDAAATSGAATAAAASTEAGAVTAANEEIIASNAETAGSMDSMTTAFSMGGLAIAAAVGVAAVAVTKIALDWQETMTTLRNATGAPEEAVKAIGDAMGTLSEKVTFSEGALANALSGVAGQWQQYTGQTLDAKSATDLMGQAAELAMVSHGNLNNVTSDLVKTMIAFQVPASQAASVTDTLWNTSRLTGVSVDGLSQAMDRLKGRLGNASPSLNDVATLTDSLAQHGISGSRGVMAVSSAFEHLLAGSKIVRGELSALGLSIYDSSGKFIGMRAVIAELGPKLATLSDQQRNVALNMLFGATAGGMMSGVLADGVGKWDKYSSAVSASGSVAADYQNIQADLLTKFDELKNRAGELARVLGDDLLGAIQRLVDVAAPYAQMIESFIQRHQELARVLLIAAAAVGATAVAFGIGATATLALSAATVVLGATLGAAFLPVTLAVVAAAVLGYEAYKHWDTITATLHTTVTALTTAFQDTVSWLKETYANSQQLQDIWAGLQKAGDLLAQGAEAAWAKIKTDVQSATSGIMAGLQGLYRLWEQDGPAAVNALEVAVRNVFDFIDRFISGGMAQWEAAFSSGWASIQDMVKLATDAIVTTVRVGWDLISGQIETVVKTLATLISTQFNAWRDIIEGVMTTINDLLHGRWSNIAADLEQILKGFVEVFEGLWKTLVTFLQGMVGTFTQAGKDLLNGLVGSFKDGLKLIEDAVDTLIHAAIAEIEGWVNAFDTSGGKIVQGLIDGIAAKAGDVVNAAANMGKSLWNGFKSGLGDLMPGSPSKIGLAIPKGLSSGMQSGMSSVKAAAHAMAAAATAEVKAAYTDQVQAVKDGLAQQSQAIADAHTQDMQTLQQDYANQEQIIKDSFQSQIQAVQAGMVGLKKAARDGGNQQIADLKAAEKAKLDELKAFDQQQKDLRNQSYATQKLDDKTAAADQLATLKGHLGEILAELKSGAIDAKTAVQDMVDGATAIAASGGAAAGAAFAKALNTAIAAASAAAGGGASATPATGDLSGGGTAFNATANAGSALAAIQQDYLPGSIHNTSGAANQLRTALNNISASAYAKGNVARENAGIRASMVAAPMGPAQGTTVVVNIGAIHAIDPAQAAQIVSQHITQQVLAGGRI